MTTDAYRAICQIRHPDGRTTTTVGQPIPQDVATAWLEQAGKSSRAPGGLSMRVVTEAEYLDLIQQELDQIIASATGGAS